MKTMEESGYVDGYTDEESGETGVEIYGRDVIYLNGKVTSKTPLLTAAQDFAGAINELFQSGSGGGDEDWIFPEHWLDIPDPEPNQVILYVEAESAGYGFVVQFYSNSDTDYTRSGVVEWGDGASSAVVSTAELSASNFRICHKYTDAGQYIVKINCNRGETGGYAVRLTNTYGNDADSGDLVNSLNLGWVKAVKVGSEVEVCASSDESVDGTNYAAFNTFSNLMYVKFIGAPSYCYFANLRYLKKIEFGGDITKLPFSAFSGCHNLERADFTGKITEFPRYAFNACHNLKSVDLSSAITIGIRAFSSCESLKNISITAVTTISDYAFSYCYALTNIKAPALTEIQNKYAFSYCHNLKTFEAPLLTTMNSESFSYCYGLKTFNAPMLAEIAVTEFTGCYALEELTLAADCNYNGNTFSNCQLLYPKPQ